MRETRTMKLHRALYVSRHFEFEAYGMTADEAGQAMFATLAAHARQYGLKENWYDTDDISIYPVETGQGLRDRTPVKAT